MAQLTTHVLDTSRGVPGRGIDVELHRLDQGQRTRVAVATTNVDGRPPAPLIAGDVLPIGLYELTFHVAEYLRTQGVALASPPFLGDVVIRIGIADPLGHYHVPLLLSPYGYSTYRGS